MEKVANIPEVVGRHTIRVPSTAARAENVRSRASRRATPLGWAETLDDSVLDGPPSASDFSSNLEASALPLQFEAYLLELDPSRTSWRAWVVESIWDYDRPTGEGRFRSDHFLGGTARVVYAFYIFLTQQFRAREESLRPVALDVIPIQASAVPAKEYSRQAKRRTLTVVPILGMILWTWYRCLSIYTVVNTLILRPAFFRQRKSAALLMYQHQP